jgi:hypothetical protein
LKTGGGIKPLCADKAGTFYICGTNTTTKSNPQIYAAFVPIPNNPNLADAGGVGAAAALTVGVKSGVTAEIGLAYYDNSVTPPSVSFLDKIKNQFTTYAVSSNTCPYSATTADIGSEYILPGSTSSPYIIIDSRCTSDLSKVHLSIISYSPHTTSDGQTITAR